MSDQPPGPQVELVDLSVISQYSLALRCATADARELADALRADLAYVEGKNPQQPARRMTRARPDAGAGDAGPKRAGGGAGGAAREPVSTAGRRAERVPTPPAARAPAPTTGPASGQRPRPRRGTPGG